MTSDKAAIVAYMDQCEREGRFDVHTTPPELSLSLPVDENYNYLQTGWRNFFKKAFAHLVDGFVERKIIKKLFDLEIRGEENRKGIPRSVVVCNHVHMFDCVIVRRAYHRKNIYITAAEFNNRGDFLGFLMRYNGMLPFSSNRKAQRNFHRAVEKILTAQEGHLLVFPEASEWWYYKKPRPFKPGAFHYAVQYGVPVQPMFITFADDGRTDGDGNPTPKACLHIAPAVFPRTDLGRRENEAWLAQKAFDAMKEIYEETYGVPLTYTCEEPASQRS